MKIKFPVQIKNKKKLRNAMLFLLAFLVLAAAACYTLFIKPSAEEERYIYKEATVEHGDLMQGIMESGVVELMTVTQDFDVQLEDEEDDEEEDEEDDDETSSYLKVEEVYVAPGQRITAGQPVMKVTEKSIRSVRRNIQADMADARIALEDAQNAYELEEVSAKHTYTENLTASKWSDAQYAVDTAMIETEAAALADEIAVLEQEIVQMETELEDGWEDYADLKEEFEMYERRYQEWDKDNLYEYIPLRTKYLDTKERYETETENRLDQRQQMEDKQEEILEKQEELEHMLGKTERRRLDARQDYEKSLLAGETAQDVYTYSLQSLEEEIADAGKEVEKYTERLADFDAFVGGDGTIYAAEDGLVTAVSYEEGDSLVEESALITYVKEDEYVLSIDVSEEDIPYVNVGDSVTVELGAYPEEIYQGQIQKVTTTEISQDAKTVSYPVTVKILGDTSRMYGGMTGDVTFITDKVEKVDYVSRKAIVKEDDRSFVNVKDENGNMVKKEVETGFSDGVNIEIKSGLSQGDTVYIASRISADQDESRLMDSGEE